MTSKFQCTPLNFWVTHVFNIRARLDGNHITVLDSEVVSDNSVDAGTAVIKIFVGKDDEDGVLPLLSAHKDGITTEDAQSLHGSLGEADDGVIVVGGIGYPSEKRVRMGSSWSYGLGKEGKHEHQLVGLLLFLENGGSSLIFLVLIVSLMSSKQFGDGRKVRETNLLNLSARGIAVKLKTSARGLIEPWIFQPSNAEYTYVKLTFFLWSWWSGILGYFDVYCRVGMGRSG